MSEYSKDIFTGGFCSDKKVKSIMNSNNLYNRSDIEWYTKFNRFGCLDPYNSLTNTREYLFFTKPDLHICEPGTGQMNPELNNNSFFTELFNRYPSVISQLQESAGIFGASGEYGDNYPFMNVLSNSVKNTMDMPEISSGMVDNAATLYGTSIEYRGDGFSSDEKHDFSLEFEDTKYLELYHLFKAYEEYERLKNVGLITPPNIDFAPVDEESGYCYSYYIKNKVLHDQFAIYKFIVDEDYETIIYYAVAQGVTIKSVPREAFSDIKPDGGLRYSVNFVAQFVFDMEPWILTNFNALINRKMGYDNSTPTYLPVYNFNEGRVDGRWAVSPYIVRKLQSDYNPGVWLGPSSMMYDYKLKWRIS